LGAGEILEEVIEFNLPKDSFGEFDFVLTLIEGDVEIVDVEKLFLPSGSGLTGLAISDDNRRTLSTLGIILVGVIIAVAIGWIVRKHRRKRKKVHYKKRKLLEFEF